MKKIKRINMSLLPQCLEVKKETQRKGDGILVNSCLHVVDLAKVQPSTDLEQQLLRLLQDTLDRSTNLEGQFEEYKSMVKTTFFDNLVDAHG